jgi:hypothetical protein
MQVHTLTNIELEPAPAQIGEPFRCWECGSPDQGGMFLIIDHSPLEAFADHVYYGMIGHKTVLESIRVTIQSRQRKKLFLQG